MPYTATIISSAINGGNKEITIDYTNGGANTIRETVRSSAPTLTWLQGLVRDRLAQLDQMAAFTPPNGAFAPPAVTPPTQFETDRNTWRLNLSRLKVALVVFAETDPVVVNLRSTLQTTYQSGFLD